MRSRLLVAAGLLALAAPATAAADTTLTAGPLKVRDYQLNVLATDGAKDSLTLMLTRRSGGSTQTHMYAFASGVTVKAGGRKPSIVARLGRYGSVKLAVGGLRAGARGTVPGGCTGSPGKQERGTFTGALKVTLDTTYFKTVKASRLPGTRATGGSLRCDGDAPGQQRSGLMLNATAQREDGSFLMFGATRDGAGKVTQQAIVNDAAAKVAPASSAMHMIVASAPASGFTVAADLSSAAVAAAAPFLSGALSFQGEAFGDMATGALAGGLTARFDSIGAQTVPADATGMLIRR